ncbi:Dephospho-CoA kinase [Nocardia sp. RB56]|uniref:Dephospho-CoA kinase n=2 Tax=Nocardia aurantia TaxID=2585199 RepID=A0A7K0DIB9_9NOCA|nr:dephospho-CoA kinase [Nocardia aurantia]MQY25378.1 Dephospho-CoA kinase [Nocardia aurantia]
MGLTGGMGAGKSTVSRRLVERGAVLIDSDAIAREVVEPGTEGLTALVEAFGPDILDADGRLDRAELAAKAFASDETRATLNGITHPLVGKRAAELLDAAPADAIVVQDVPLLVENGMGVVLNLVAVVMAEVDVRVRRLEEYRGIAAADALIRIKAQATDEQRRAAADVLLDNNGGPDDLAPQVAALWERLVSYEEHLRTRTPAPRGPLRPVAPDAGRADAAQRIIGRLWTAAGATARRIDHIGGTAVPDLPGPDVLDIQITVADPDAADALREPLATIGFPRVDESAAGTDSAGERVHANTDPGRAVNLYVRVDGSPEQRFALDFRDWLRADADARAEYATVQRDAEARAAGLTGAAAVDAYRAVERAWVDEIRSRVPSGER